MNPSSVAYDLIAALTETLSCLEAKDAMAAATAVERAAELWNQAHQDGVKIDNAAMSAIRQLHQRCAETSAALQENLESSVMQAGASRRALGAYATGQNE